MKTLLAVAASALALNCIATADVLASSDAAKRAPVVKAPVLAAPVAADLHVTTAAPSIEKTLAPVAEPTMKWSWIPAKAPRAADPGGHAAGAGARRRGPAWAVRPDLRPSTQGLIDGHPSIATLSEFRLHVSTT